MAANTNNYVNACNTSYDNQFMSIQVSYNSGKKVKPMDLHKEYLPYVGLDYDKYKILQIGESHYLRQNAADPNNLEIDYFMKNWFMNNCPQIINRDTFNTRKVINGVMDGTNNFYSIFANFAEVFRQANPSMANIEKRELYSYFAFTDFYMIPALYAGYNIKRSFRESVKNGVVTKEECNEFIEEIERISRETIDKIIDVLEPKKIIFTSKAAWDAYTRKEKDSNAYDARHADEAIHACHPGSPWWHRQGGVKGKKIVEGALII